MLEFLAALLAIGFGFGLAFWICGNTLNKSNNIGDSRGNGATYNAVTKFTSTCNSMEKSAATSFFNSYASKREDPTAQKNYEPVRRLTEEERKQHAIEQKKKNAPKGAFVSKNTGGYSSEAYKKPDWESRADHYF
ncbi:MAG: hypothetical protein IKE92_06605 [Clostridiales bacterium]|nr:hypothetical protein [Clostridiales bacterium]